MVRHPFHLVEYSPWPLSGACGGFILAIGLVNWFYNCGITCLLLGMMLITMTMIQWWRDVVRESTFMGYHTSMVGLGMRMGMGLFILSEILFFFAFFWAFFHSSLAPDFEVGCVWPPSGVESLSPFSIPLLNTVVLLGSGVSLTWSHHSLMKGDEKESVKSLLITILMGGYFSFLQVMEYSSASFSISDGVYGALFFVATGFHGLHVFIGTTFLTVCFYRLKMGHYSKTHHFGFEAAAWYWHFVDVVWIFLYLCIYWWGS
uniref:cytochrome c oxidase subunit III n=1 Tax=Antonbruunia milenae TaxID=3053535 RepID=UPI0030E06790